MKSVNGGVNAYGRHVDDDGDGSGHAAGAKARDNNSDCVDEHSSRQDFRSHHRRQLHLQPAQVMQASTVLADATDMATQEEKATVATQRKIMAAVLSLHDTSAVPAAPGRLLVETLTWPALGAPPWRPLWPVPIAQATTTQSSALPDRPKRDIGQSVLACSTADGYTREQGPTTRLTD